MYPYEFIQEVCSEKIENDRGCLEMLWYQTYEEFGLDVLNVLLKRGYPNRPFLQLEDISSKRNYWKKIHDIKKKKRRIKQFMSHKKELQDAFVYDNEDEFEGTEEEGPGMASDVEEESVKKIKIYKSVFEPPYQSFREVSYGNVQSYISDIISKLSNKINSNDLMFTERYLKDSVPYILKRDEFSNDYMNLLSYILGTYGSKEYSVLHVSRIASFRSQVDKTTEFARQNKLYNNNSLPHNKDMGPYLFDKYAGDWKGTRAVFCVINLLSFETFEEEKKQGKQTPDYTYGKQWVVLVFTPGRLQSIDNVLEDRSTVQTSKKEDTYVNRFYLFDPFVLSEVGEDEYLTSKSSEDTWSSVFKLLLGMGQTTAKTSLLLPLRMTRNRNATVNRSIELCFQAGILSLNCVGVTGYKPGNTTPPREFNTDVGTLSDLGVIDDVMLYSQKENVYTNYPLLKDRRAILNEYFRRTSTVIETIHPSLLWFCETSELEMTPWYVLSFIMTLIKEDLNREKEWYPFPYESKEIMRAFSKIGGKSKEDKSGINWTDVIFTSKHRVPSSLRPYKPAPPGFYRRLNLTPLLYNLTLINLLLENVSKT